MSIFSVYKLVIHVVSAATALPMLKVLGGSMQVVEDDVPLLEYDSDTPHGHDGDPMDDVFCMTCGGGDDEDQMVLCDGKREHKH